MWKIMRFSNYAWEYVLVHPKQNQDFVKEHNRTPLIDLCNTAETETIQNVLLEVK